MQHENWTHGRGEVPACPPARGAILAACLLAAIPVRGRAADALPVIGNLKELSLEELMDIEVTLVSKSPQKWSEAAAAIQVITREEIRRSGAASLPEALRLASNLQVARKTGREWAISARGFNSTAANKLLVMIDGRTVYTPLYSGVFWDAQHVFLEDVERIEVISGPGGTLWGSNAVNGVINIITLNAGETQGAFLSLGGGSRLRFYDRARYGGTFGEDFSYRVYGQRYDHNSLVKPDGESAKNGWDLSQGGFRADWKASGADRLTLQGDIYSGDFTDPPTGATENSGQNVLARWEHAFQNASTLTVQAYFDRTIRNSDLAPNFGFSDELKTYDLETHYRFPIGSMNEVTVGAGYRLMQDEVENFPLYIFPFPAFLPADKDLHRMHAFVQDEISLLSRRLRVTVGTKVESEEYSGVNLQPSARAAWSPTDHQTLWTSVSRAVRTPSRIDVEFFVAPPAPNALKIGGGADFESEELLAYELGYRIQPAGFLSLSVSLFYNQYDDIRAATFGKTPDGGVDFTTAVFDNGIEADSRGVELSGDFQPASWCRFKAGYTYLESDFWTKPGFADPKPRGDSNDPAHQASVLAMVDLPYSFGLNVAGYFVDALPDPRVKARLNYDAGLTWSRGHLEASVFGRNLADDHEPEFGPAEGRIEVPRSVYALLTLRI